MFSPTAVVSMSCLHSLIWYFDTGCIKKTTNKDIICSVICVWLVMLEWHKISKPSLHYNEYTRPTFVILIHIFYFFLVSLRMQHSIICSDNKLVHFSCVVGEQRIDSIFSFAFWKNTFFSFKCHQLRLRSFKDE